MSQVSAPIWAHIGVRLRERSLAETGAGQGHSASGEEAKPSELARRVGPAWGFPKVGALTRGTLERRPRAVVGGGARLQWCRPKT